MEFQVKTCEHKGGQRMLMPERVTSHFNSVLWRVWELLAVWCQRSDLCLMKCVLERNETLKNLSEGG